MMTVIAIKNSEMIPAIRIQIMTIIVIIRIRKLVSTIVLVMVIIRRIIMLLIMITIIMINIENDISRSMI